MRNLRLLFLVGLATLAAAGCAQLVVGSTSTSATGSGAFFVDFTTDPNQPKATRLWSGSSSGLKVNGMTADNASGALYTNDSARLMRWSFGSVGSGPSFVSGFYRPTTSGTAPTTTAGPDDLFMARGNLYAYANTASTTAPAGIFRIDLSVVGSASVANMAPVWTQTVNVQYNFDGLDYDPVTGFAYGANVSTGDARTAPLGLYRIDLSGANATPVKIADFDASFMPEPDGVAIGGGKVWLSGKNGADPNLLIESYDLSTGTFGDLMALPLADASNRSTDIAWAPNALRPVPEPTTCAALALGLLALRRRRRA